MGYQKFNGVIKKIVEQQPADIIEVLQEKLQIPLDKAEDLANRINIKFCVKNETTKNGIIKRLIEKQTDSDEVKNKIGPYTSAICYLSNEEFVRIIVWIFEEFGYEVQPEGYKTDAGFQFIIRKENEKIAVQARKYSTDYKLTETIVDLSENTRFTYECNRSIVIATTFFTSQAIDYAEKLGVELWNLDVIAKKIETIKRKAEAYAENSFSKYEGSLKQSLMKLAETKDFIIEPRSNETYDLYLFGVKYPLLTFQVQSGVVTKCVYRIRYNEPVGENEGEVLIQGDDNNRVNLKDAEAYKLIIEYLEQFIE